MELSPPSPPSFSPKAGIHAGVLNEDMDSRGNHENDGEKKMAWIPVDATRMTEGRRIMNQNTGKRFIYWDNSNIFISARHVAVEREGADAYYRVRISFESLFALARADRDVENAVAVGSIPPEMEHLWNRMERQGVKVKLLERGVESNTEQGVDESLQNYMLEDTVDYNGTPGVVVLLTGDGKGFHEGKGFHKTVERMHKKGWKVEILSWTSSCNKYMLDWVNEYGTFVALEDFYESITFLQPPLPGMEHAPIRHAAALDLSRRPVS